MSLKTKRTIYFLLLLTLVTLILYQSYSKKQDSSQNEPLLIDYKISKESLKQQPQGVIDTH